MKAVTIVSAIALVAATPVLAQEPTKPASPQPTSEFSTQMSLDQHLASKWIGVEMQNASGESVGDINDFVFDNDGRIIAVVTGVGGFLGLGEKNVALKFDSVEFTQKSDGTRTAMTAATKEVLKAAPTFNSGEKTMKDRMKDASDAASDAYQQAKEKVKEGYAAAKKSVEENYEATKKALTEEEKKNDSTNSR
jgi:PRC-barrel domain